MTTEEHIKAVIEKFKFNSLEDAIYRAGVVKGLELAKKEYRKIHKK